MDRRLHPTLPRGSGETPIGFASRLAALHSTPLRDFCLDMGLAFQAIVDGCSRALGALAALAGADGAELMAEAVTRTGERTFEHKGQVLRRSHLRRSRVLVCPTCLGEDLAGEGRVRIRAKARTLWTLDPIRTCPVHHRALVQVADVREPDLLHDFANNVRPALGRLGELEALSKLRCPSDLERYLVDRIDGVETGGTALLDTLEWHEVSDLCHLVGAVTLYGRNVGLGRLGDDEWHSAGDAGFVLAQGSGAGLDALLAALDASYPGANSSTEGPQAVFGKLFTVVAFGSDDKLDVLREAIRRHVVAHWAFGPQDAVFGVSLGARVRHSIRSASLEYGIHRKRLRKILEATGTVRAGETDERTIFDAEASREILEKTRTAVSLTQVETMYNTGRVQAVLLMRAGFITPFVTFSEGEFNFARTDLDRFMGLLLRNAAPVVDETEGARDIPAAAKRTNCGAAEIVMLIVWGDLPWIGFRKDVGGYLGIRVKIDQVKTRLHGERPAGSTAREVEGLLHATTKTVAALIENGHLSTRRTANPVNRCPLVLVTPESLEAFASTHVSLFALAKERGQHFRRLKRELEHCGVEPALHYKIYHATYYRRADV